MRMLITKIDRKDDDGDHDDMIISKNWRWRKSWWYDDNSKGISTWWGSLRKDAGKYYDNAEKSTRTWHGAKIIMGEVIRGG